MSLAKDGREAASKAQLLVFHLRRARATRLRHPWQIQFESAALGTLDLATAYGEPAFRWVPRALEAPLRDLLVAEGAAFERALDHVQEAALACSLRELVKVHVGTLPDDDRERAVAREALAGALADQFPMLGATWQEAVTVLGQRNPVHYVLRNTQTPRRAPGWDKDDELEGGQCWSSLRQRELRRDYHHQRHSGGHDVPLNPADPSHDHQSAAEDPVRVTAARESARRVLELSQGDEERRALRLLAAGHDKRQVAAMVWPSENPESARKRLQRLCDKFKTLLR